MRKEKGITLIALVVTIIILLILAGVTLGLVLSNGGLIDKTKQAIAEHEKSQEKEKDELGKAAEMMGKLIDELEGSEGGTSPEQSGAGGSDGDDDSNKNDIAKQYGIEQTGEKKVSDGKDDVWIPRGYTVLDPNKNKNVSYEDNNNPKIDEGIVIADKIDETGKSTGNEFVWVPVRDISTMYDETSKKGKSYSFNDDGEEQVAYDESKVTLTELTLNGMDKKSEYYLDILGFESSDDFKSQLETEFENMIESIKHYNGFYIGRYPTTNCGQESNIVPDVKAGIVVDSSSPLTNRYWIYKNSHNIKKPLSNVDSGMIFGCQWDEVMNWLLSSSVEYERHYVVAGWDEDLGFQISKRGSGDLIDATGIDRRNADGLVLNRVKNIYDLASPWQEVTIEFFKAGSEWSARGGTQRLSDVWRLAMVHVRWAPCFGAADV